MPNPLPKPPVAAAAPKAVPVDAGRALKGDAAEEAPPNAEPVPMVKGVPKSDPVAGAKEPKAGTMAAAADEAAAALEPPKDVAAAAALPNVKPVAGALPNAEPVVALAPNAAPPKGDAAPDGGNEKNVGLADGAKGDAAAGTAVVVLETGAAPAAAILRAKSAPVDAIPCVSHEREEEAAGFAGAGAGLAVDPTAAILRAKSASVYVSFSASGTFCHVHSGTNQAFISHLLLASAQKSLYMFKCTSPVDLMPCVSHGRAEEAAGFAAGAAAGAGTVACCTPCASMSILHLFHLYTTHLYVFRMLAVGVEHQELSHCIASRVQEREECHHGNNATGCTGCMMVGERRPWQGKR